MKLKNLKYISLTMASFRAGNLTAHHVGDMACGKVVSPWG